MEAVLTTILTHISNINMDTFVLLIAALTTLIVGIYWHSDKTTRFDLRDLVIDSRTKELSVYKTGQLVALMVTTWIMIYQTRADKMSEWLFSAYMLAWGGINIANKVVSRGNNVASPSDDPVIDDDSTPTKPSK